MNSRGSDAARRRVRRVFSERAEPHTPLTLAEVAETADCAEDDAREALETLEAHGELHTRVVDDRLRVWWVSEATASPARRSEEEEEELEAFVSAVKDYAIFMLDPDGTVASWNEGAKRIKGYDEAEIVGEHFSTFYTEENIDAGVPEENLKAAASEEYIEDEGWRVRQDGSRFWAHVTITPIRTDDGALRGFTKVTRDMTERREYERRLREERDITEQILEMVPVSVLVTTADGTIVRANDRILDRLAPDRSDLTGENIGSWEIYDQDGEPISIDDWPWTRVLETGEPIHHFVCRMNLPEIGMRWLSVNAAPLDNDRSDDEHIVFAVDDITDRKEGEAQLRRQYNQTERLLRTAPIALAVHDSDGNTIMANQRAQDELGLSERELIEDPDRWTMVDGQGDPIPSSETPSRRVLSTGDPIYNEEITIESPDGERKHYRVNAAPVFDPDGELERVVTAGEDITELKRRERQLEQQKAELETELSEILGRISDAFYALDDEWRFTHLNDFAADLLQRPREELLGQKIWEMFPNAAAVYRENFQRAMETQEPVTFEQYVEDIGAWQEFNVYPSETGISIYFRDITERIEREQTLAKYEAIVETVPDGIYVKDEDGMFTLVNDAYAEMTGYEKSELIGAHASLVVDEETIEQASRQKDHARAEEEDSPVMEAELETATGDRIPAEGTFATIETEGGETEHVGVVRDISERKEYQRKIEKSERRYRTLAENFPNGIVALFDDDLRYIAAGGQLLERMNVDIDEALGQSIYERYPDDVIEEIEPSFLAALDGEEDTFEMRFNGRDLLAYTLPVDPAGDPPTGMLVIQDITEQREYERKLKSSNERLEQFAYAASHDLQEPLRMVSSYLQLIESRYSDRLDEDGREFLEFAVDGADRMRDMIDGLLKYSRVDTHGDPFQSVDLNEVLEDVRDDLRMRIEESDAAISVESLPHVYGDSDQLRQVFQNLLDNAIEYSGDEPPRIRVSAQRDGDKWAIAVHDEGIGIDPENADRVFEVFQSLQDTTQHSGTGIGLAICERIVERHGGEIWVESQPGSSSTFRFTLPAEGERGD